MTDLQIGGVYRLDRKSEYDGFGPIEQWDTVERVLCYDQFEIIADTELNIGQGNWIFNHPMKRHTFFGRRPIRFYEDYAEYLGFSGVLDNIVRFYRFDLPLRISRIKELNWFDPVFEKDYELDIYIDKKTSQQWKDQKINAISVYIKAGGDAGGLVLIHADNGNYFTASEMLKKGHQVIKPKHKNLKGVGIFRSGTRAGIPVFYVGEYFDRAGFLKEFEEKGIETNI